MVSHMQALLYQGEEDSYIGEKEGERAMVNSPLEELKV